MEHRRRTAGIAGAVSGALLMCAAVLAGAPGALAAGSIDIHGTVVDGTTGARVPKLEVTLHLLAGQNELGTLSTATDASGRFSFPEPPSGPQAYELSTEFKGATYTSAVTTLPIRTPSPAKLEVYDTTTDPADVTLVTWTIWVDRDGSGAAIQHDLRWRNDGATTYVGTEAPAGGTRVVTRVPLERGASDPQYLGAYLQTPGRTEGSTYVNPQPLVPGVTTATLRYAVGSLTRLTLPIDFPTNSLQLFVPAEATVSAPGLIPGGRFTDRGVTYQSWSGSDLKTGQTLEVRVSDLEGGGSSLVVLVVGTLVVAILAGLALWLLVRRRTRASPRARAARGTGTRGAGARRPRPDEGIDLLIDEIAALDLAHEHGLLQDRSYESLRAAAKRRLRELGGERSRGGARR